MRKILQSFQWAMNGIRTAWREEVNFRFEIASALIVIGVGAWLRLLLLEWIIIVGCITAVIGAELINTAIEDICDKIEPDEDPAIGKVKDLMAGFVLVVALAATIIAAIIFSNYL